MDVSVIIPTYNRAATLVRSLTSVINQSLPPREIILVDDGSTDRSEFLVRQQFPQVRYLKQPNLGVSRARNCGIAAAKGEWIAFLDSDDEWLPSKLAAQRAALRREPFSRICHTDEIWLRSGKHLNPMKKHQKRGGRIFQHCLPLCVISPSAVMVHRSVFQRVGAFDESLPVCEDYDLWLRICALYPVLYVPERLLIKHGGHSDQLSQGYWGMDRFRIRALEKILRSPDLCGADRAAALEALLHKIEIYLAGAEKRNKRHEVRSYTRKRQYYRYLLQDPLCVA